MSLGSPRIVVRIPPALLQLITDYLRLRNDHRPKDEWDLSDFVRAAIREKVAHIQRSKKSRLKQDNPTAEEESVDLGRFVASDGPESGVNLKDSV